MKVKRKGDYWQATGEGFKRDIIAEGKTREEAFKAWCDINRAQVDEEISSNEFETLMEEIARW